MSKTSSPRIPSCRLRRPSGRAVDTLGGRDHYLGRHNSPQSKAAYKRLVSEWPLKGQTTQAAAARDDLSVNEVTLALLRFAEQHYRRADGDAAREVPKLKNTLRTLFELYGDSPALEFGPLALKTIRQSMVGRGLCRSVINSRVGQIKRLFKWDSSEQLIPATVYHGLLCVDGLRLGKGGAREVEPVRPVADADVDAVLPFMCPTVQATVQLQRLIPISLHTAEIDWPLASSTSA